MCLFTPPVKFTGLPKDSHLAGQYTLFKILLNLKQNSPVLSLRMSHAWSRSSYLSWLDNVENKQAAGAQSIINAREKESKFLLAVFLIKKIIETFAE